MIRNYFKIPWRNLWKDKGYSLLNVLGLSVGMAAAVLITLWVLNERSYDMFHHKKDRLYKVMNRATYNGKTSAWDYTPKVMGPVLKAEFSEIANVTREAVENPFLLTVGEKKMTVPGVFVDSVFLDMFDFPLLAGNKKNVLVRPTDIVITESLGKKLFGDENPMGRSIQVESEDILTVSGVLADLPDNSTFSKFEYFLPWTYLEKLGWSDDNWGNNSGFTYVELKDGVSKAAIESKIRDVTQRHSGTIDDIEIFLHALPDWWLRAAFEDGKAVGGRIETVQIFSLIACFILIIACINFMNLSTARSERRAKEVGVRKVAGASRSSITMQFLGESIFMAAVSGIIALLLIIVCLPSFNALVGRSLELDFTNGLFWLLSLAFILFTGILAGSYPAFLLSSFQPIKALKNSLTVVGSTISLRKVLVVFQFTIAIFLIVSTLVVHRQLQYGENRKNGYEKNNLIYIILKGDMEKNYSLIKNELLSQGIASSITKTMSPITEIWSNGMGVDWRGKPENDKTGFDRFRADESLVKTAGLKLVQGRDFDLTKFPTDSTALLLNEAAVKAMGFENPIGEIVKDNGINWHVVGVVEDFITRSPYSPVTPLLIEGAMGWSGVMHIKFSEQLGTADALEKAQAVFKKYNQAYPFEYQFVDEAYAEKFEETQRVGSLAALFASLTIFISCLGLFGLAAHTAQNRTKEIGVRKVLGASVLSITNLLSKEFLYLVAISCLVAFPLAYWAMDGFLMKYEYRIMLGWGIFAVAGIASVLIALVTVSSQAIKAALANPVHSLRDE